jgi:ectoine hydroxylase-related dioxygenase (phytanoyl-CoA dioxygenase family)
MNESSFPTVTPEMIDRYRQDGFVHVPNLISKDEAAQFRAAALDASERLVGLGDGSIFNQYVNVWQHDEGMRALTLHPNVQYVAKLLSGVPLRLWHDQILIKQPGTSRATEFHQDQPYWPHQNSINPISCWIALGDVPVEAGCMTFLPGSQRRTDLPAQNLADSRSLMEICPEFVWSPRVTVPIQAGGCTFHHGRCAHMATPNASDSPRVAHIVIFMDAETQYSGAGHIVTDPLQLSVGDTLDHELFPLAA